MNKIGYTYILASKRNGTLYIGVTGNLAQRIKQHQSHVVTSFTQKYHAQRLVWFEEHDLLELAILREKRLKKWNRAWKIELIERTNPNWQDVSVQAL